MSAVRPLPTVDYLDHKPFWDATRSGKIMVQKCTACGAVRFPPRPACTKCGSLDVEWVELDAKGHLYSWTVTHVAMNPYFADAVPYAVVVVELAGGEGIRMLGRLAGADPGALHLGLPMRAVFEEIDERVTLVNWKPEPKPRP